jgi:hypothetical protein
MKKLNIFLAETTYETLAAHAAVEAIDAAQFCSAILTEFADKNRQTIDNQHVTNSQPPDQDSLPDTITQVMAVSKYVLVDGLGFNEAIQSTTVRDKCTRRISLGNTPLDTSQFNFLLSQPTMLRDHLCQRFPNRKTEIMGQFKNLIAMKAVVPASPSNGNGAKKPKMDINEKQLVQAIITVLHENGGAASKSIVEDSVFQKLKFAFDDPFYHEMVGPQVGFPGVPRWRKNIEFARNTAREMGLIKTPEESGRGIWALTESGKQWRGQ